MALSGVSVRLDVDGRTAKALVAARDTDLSGSVAGVVASLVDLLRPGSPRPAALSPATAGVVEFVYETSGFESEIAAAIAKLSALEASLAQRVVECLLGGVDGAGLKLSVSRLPAAAGAGDDVIRFRIDGFAELFAAAMAAADCDSSHSRSPG